VKTYKSIDFFAQIGLLAMIILAFIIDNYETLNPMLFIMGIAVVQIISILTHSIAGHQVWKKKAWRKYHLIGTALVFALLIVALVQDSSGRSGDKDDKYSMPGLETLIYATIPAILLSLFYVVITGVEWKKLKGVQ
jgi:glucose-6-phosphate-specific signal transduction histidine kinase